MKKTQEKLQKAIEIAKSFNTRAYTYKDVSNAFADNNMNGLNFYTLTYAKCVSKVGRGLYVNTDLLYKITPSELYKMEGQRIYGKRAVDNPIQPKLNFADDKIEFMINHIKSLGFKVLKPQTEYKEI